MQPGQEKPAGRIFDALDQFVRNIRGTTWTNDLWQAGRHIARLAGNLKRKVMPVAFRPRLQALSQDMAS